MTGVPRGRLLLVGFWVLPAIIGTLGLALVPSRLNPDLSVPQLLVSQLLLWLAWGAWSLLIVSVGTRFPFSRGRLGRALADALTASAELVVSLRAVSSPEPEVARVGASRTELEAAGGEASIFRAGAVEGRDHPVHPDLALLQRYFRHLRAHRAERLVHRDAGGTPRRTPRQ